MMKEIQALVLTSALACAAGVSGAEHQEDDAGVLASRGAGVVTHELFDTRVSRIPERHRAAVLRDRRRLQDLLNQLLLHAQLLEDARAAGLQDDPAVQARMALAADEELVKAWLQRYPSTREPADYEAMAREYFAVNRDQFKTEETIDVTHILISTKERSDEDALRLAQKVHTLAMAAPETFDALVDEYSDDSSAASNHGRFTQVPHGQMVKPFEKVAFELAVGEISEPVKTVFGYHVIRLDRTNPPRQQPFEEVRSILEERMQRQHEERVKNEYLTYLNQQNVEMTPDALEAMVARYFDEDMLQRRSGEGQSE